MAAGSGAARTSIPSIWTGAPEAAVRSRSVSRPSLRTTPRPASPLSRFGGDADDPNSALIFDRKAVPAALADGLPSALASASAEAPGARGVSPYRLFADVIDVPNSGRRALFPLHPHGHQPAQRRSVGQPRLFWAAVRRYSLQSRLAPLPLTLTRYTAGRGRRTMGTRVTPTLSPSPLSALPSSDAAKPFGQVGDEAGRSAVFLWVA